MNGNIRRKMTDNWAQQKRQRMHLYVDVVNVITINNRRQDKYSKHSMNIEIRTEKLIMSNAWINVINFNNEYLLWSCRRCWYVMDLGWLSHWFIQSYGCSLNGCRTRMRQHTHGKPNVYIFAIIGLSINLKTKRYIDEFVFWFKNLESWFP